MKEIKSKYIILLITIATLLLLFNFVALYSFDDTDHEGPDEKFDLKKLSALTTKYKNDLDKLSGEAKGQKAYQLLNEIKKQKLMNILLQYPIYYNYDNKYVLEYIFDSYVYEYPNSNIQQIAYLFDNKMDCIKGLSDCSYYIFGMYGQTYMLHQTANKIIIYDIGNSTAPQIIVGGLKNPVNIFVVADYDCRGSGCSPKIRLVTIKDGVLTEVYKSKFYYENIEMLYHDLNNVGNEIVGLCPVPSGRDQSIHSLILFPSIFKWDGKDLIDTTFEHGEYIVNFYNAIILSAKSNNYSYEIRFDVERLDKLDLFIKNHSADGKKFWMENLKKIRENYDTWQKAKTSAK